jgi:hypothetical protein
MALTSKVSQILQACSDPFDSLEKL